MSISEDITPNEKTKLIYDMESAISYGVRFLQNSKERMDVFVDENGPAIIIKYNIYKDNYIKARSRGVKIRFVTEITTDNIHYCKELSTIVDEFRHLDNIKGSICINDFEFLGTTTWRVRHLLTPVIYSNEKEVVEQQQYIFDTIWKKTIPIEQKVQEIEKGIKLEKIETITDPFEIETKYIQLLEKSTEEILLIFPSSNAIQRQHHLGIFQVLKEKVNQYNNLKIRIIFPSTSQLPSSLSNESLNEKINLEFGLFNSNKYKNNIFVRYMDIYLSTKSTILVIDRKESLVMEVKNDLKDKFSESVGFGTYSNSSATVTSYVSIFESLWIQTELYQQLKDANEKLKMHDIMQKDFINIAVHELRNTIQPIIGLTEFLKNKTTDKKQHEMLDTIDRNAKRLMKLSDNVLDISKIENHTLSLNKENFNLNEMMQNTILEFTNKIDKINRQQQQQHKDTLKLRSMLKDDIIIYADRSRLNQVISNLLDNAIKFTKEKEEKDGNITITVEKNCSNYVIVSISDMGKGIDSEILPRLFTKFVTKSGSGGTGLGLYISKNIIEAHGGTIWAKNNKEGEGATFGFSLPNIN